MPSARVLRVRANIDSSYQGHATSSRLRFRYHVRLRAAEDRKKMSELSRIFNEFSFLDEWEDRYRYVIELGKALPDLDD